MNPTNPSSETVHHDSWYKYGVAVMLAEMLFAVAVCAYSLYMTFHGLGGLPGKH